MTAPVLIVESDPHLHGFGRLSDAIARAGLRERPVQAYAEDVGALRASEYRAIAVMGGGMHALDDGGFPYLAREAELLRDALAHDVPVLGICLGGQLLARALGARVLVADELEGGWIPISPLPASAGDPVLGHLDGPTGSFSWHHDIFELPEGATALATGETTALQAFRHGRAWGLQFHPEVDAGLFESWLDAHPELQMDDARADALRAEVRAGSAASHDALERLFDGFLAEAIS